MRFTRIAATLVIAFLFGGGAAETYLKTRDAMQRASIPEEGAAGQLIAMELQDGSGQMIARPRVVVTPGRAVDLVLHDPVEPAKIRVAVRIEAERQLSGDLLVGYRIVVPAQSFDATGRVSLAPGVEQPIDFGDHPFGATLFTIPVPSAAFDAYLEFERARNGITRI